MAIVFAQPQPIDVNAAYGAAAREAMERDRAFALQAWNAQAQQANEQQRIGQRAYEFEASRMPSARDVFQTQVGQQEQQQRQQFAQQMQQSGFAQQQEMQQRDFTNADRLRLERLNAHRSQVDGMVSSGIITPEQREAYLQMVTPEINGLQIVQQQSMERHRQQQERLEAQQRAAQTARAAQEQRFMDAQLSSDPPRYHTDEATGQRMYWTPRTGWTPLPTQRPAAGSSPAGGRGAAQRPPDIQGMISEIERGLPPETPADQRPGMIEQRVRERLDVQRRLANMERFNPGGPLPFDPQPQTQGYNVRGVVNDAIARAMEAGAMGAESRLRGVAEAIEGGYLPMQAWSSPEDARLLEAIGYYRGEFTPEMDQQLYILANGNEPPPNAPQNFAWSAFRRTVGAVTGNVALMQDEPQRAQEAISPERRRAADSMRTLLERYGSRESMGPMRQRQFDILRRDAGFDQWPPPRPAVRNNLPNQV